MAQSGNKNLLLKFESIKFDDDRKNSPSFERRRPSRRFESGSGFDVSINSVILVGEVVSHVTCGNQSE